MFFFFFIYLLFNIQYLINFYPIKCYIYSTLYLYKKSKYEEEKEKTLCQRRNYFIYNLGK